MRHRRRPQVARLGNKPWRGRLPALPIEHRWARGYRDALILILAGLVIAYPAVHLPAVIRAGDWQFLLVLPMIQVLLGAAIVLFGSLMLGSHGLISIDHQRLTYQRTQFFLWTIRWEERLDNYLGVLISMERHSGRSRRGNKRRKYTLYLVTLEHSDSCKTILLHEHTNPNEAHRLWEHAAEVIGRPALGRLKANKLNPDLEWPPPD